NGLFGDEEITAIAPGVERARAEGIDVSGPFPCDTLFRRGFDGSFDGIVTMYHDQGQIALKTHAFDGGVTLEAGLSLPICTPAHARRVPLRPASGRAGARASPPLPRPAPPPRVGAHTPPPPPPPPPRRPRPSPAPCPRLPPRRVLPGTQPRYTSRRP